jgi:hypothetical protein
LIPTASHVGSLHETEGKPTTLAAEPNKKYPGAAA